MERALPKDGTRSSAVQALDTARNGTSGALFKEINDLQREADLARVVDIGLVTMGDTMWHPKRGGGRHTRKRRQRGFTPVEEVLIIAALMGCFVYPMSLAARSTGQQMAVQMESAHKTLLTQR